MKPRTPTREIIEYAAKVCGVEADKIRSKDRTRVPVQARQIVMAAMQAAGYSYPEIGRSLQRDHSTVHHGVRAAIVRADHGCTDTERLIVSIHNFIAERHMALTSHLDPVSRGGLPPLVFRTSRGKL